MFNKGLKAQTKTLSHKVEMLTRRADMLDKRIGKAFDFINIISNTYIPTGYLHKDLEAIKEYLGIEVVGIPAKRVVQEIDEP